MQAAEFYGCRLSDVLEMPYAEIAAVVDYLDLKAAIEAAAGSADKRAQRRIKEL